MDSKSDLRKIAKDLRKNLNIEEISKTICTKIRNLEDYKCAHNVMIFYPMKYEIDLRDLLNDNKNFYLPRTDGKNIIVCPYSADLQKSDFGVMEPNTEPIDPNILDLIFVPALMADKNGYRLGYGGGYYDRFLAKYSNIKTIIPIPKELYFDELPKENFDVSASAIITENN